MEDTKEFRIKISHEEYVHLLDIADFTQSLTTEFGPGNVWLTEISEGWAIKELAKLRGLI